MRTGLNNYVLCTTTFKFQFIYFENKTKKKCFIININEQQELQLWYSFYQQHSDHPPHWSFQDYDVQHPFLHFLQVQCFHLLVKPSCVKHSKLEWSGLYFWLALILHGIVGAIFASEHHYNVLFVFDLTNVSSYNLFGLESKGLCQEKVLRDFFKGDRRYPLVSVHLDIFLLMFHLVEMFCKLVHHVQSLDTLWKYLLFVVWGHTLAEPVTNRNIFIYVICNRIL